MKHYDFDSLATFTAILSVLVFIVAFAVTYFHIAAGLVLLLIGLFGFVVTFIFCILNDRQTEREIKAHKAAKRARMIR